MFLSFRSILSVFFLAILSNINAAEFEGKISMIKESCFETCYFNYYISKNNIRIEELNSKKELKGVYLIKLDSEEVFLLLPGKETYTKLKKRRQAHEAQNQYVTKKTGNFKFINGAKCYQWRVKNKARNTEFAYWVIQNDFGFFEKMIKVMNQHDLSWEFFNRIPDSQGFFPMVSEERNLVRDKRMTTEVLQIKRKRIEPSMFFIPSEYKFLTM